MKGLLKYLYALAFATIISHSLFAQNTTHTLYLDTAGKTLYVSPNVEVNLYINTTSSTTGAVKLTGMDGNGNPLRWGGHGPQVMTHLNLYIGRKIRFELFADGKPPITTVASTNPNQKRIDEAVYIPGGAVIEVNATDEDSGLEDTYYSLNGEPFVPYISPLTLDKDGIYEFTVYSTDKLGNREDEVTRKFVVDATPPTSAIAIEGDQFEQVVSGRSVIKLSATDEYGVKEILYRVDSSKFETYRVPFKTSFLTDGDHIIEWYATDLVGNSEPLKSYRFTVDKTPPIVVEEIAGNTYMVGNVEYSSGRSQLRIVAIDNRAGIKDIFYSLNDGEYIRYEKQVMLSDILGTINVKTYAVDNVNNRSQSGANTESFVMPTIDITGPTIGYQLLGHQLTLRDTLWIGQSTLIKLNATDKESGANRISYTIDKSGGMDYTGPFNLTEPGFHEIQCTAYDNVDNLNFLSFKLGLDSEAPKIYPHFSATPFKKIPEGDVEVYPANVKLYMAATDNLTGGVSIKYSINKGKPIDYTKPVENFKPGINYTLTITATDELGNSSTQTITFKVE